MTDPAPTPPAAAPPLVDRTLRGDALDLALARSKDLPRVPLDPTQVLDVEKIGNGTFSPLEGFMGRAAHDSVVETMRLPGGAPWSIPIILQLPAAAASQTGPGAEIVLWNAADDRPSALMEVQETFVADLDTHADRVYGTRDAAHPGVRRMMEAGPHCLAGPIRLLERSTGGIPETYDLDPTSVRDEIRRRGWRTVTGFQTRNLGHLAHEHLQKIGLELTDGLLIHPLIGWKKAGDMLPEVILEGYEILIRHYYPRERVLLAGLTTAMRYAGPREAVFHALIRRNFGCTHFIVGRDHAGVGSYYDTYAAHRIFDAFSVAELGIIPLLLHGPRFCSVCGEIVTEATCPHGPAAWVDISGTEVRAMVGRGECPPTTVMRPEIGRFLVERAKTGRVFFE